MSKETLGFIVGLVLMFGICLSIGLLDLYGKLDPILDFIGIPR